MIQAVPRSLGVVVLLVLGACAGDSAGAEAGDAGSLVVRGQPGGRLVDAPARGRACEADSTLAILAMGGGWGGAIALRVSWPPAPGDRFELREAPDQVGQAAAAVRELGDTITSAITLRRGTLTVESIADGRIGGSFAGTAVGYAGDTVRMTGTFRDVPVALGVCP